MGVDRTLLWVRKPEKIVWIGKPKSVGFGDYEESASGLPYMDRMWWRDTDTIYSRLTAQHMVGFCGRIYPVFHLTVSEPTPGIDMYATYSSYCYNISELDDFVRNHTSKACQSNYFKPPFSHKKFRRRVSKSFKPEREHFAKYFEICRIHQEAFLSLFQQHRTPVFLATKNRSGDDEVAFNASLRDVEFYRIFDPYRAYQEISMFFSNLAAPDRPIPKVSDKDMIEAKSFNEWSFRREPGRVKRRKHRQRV